MFQARDNSAFRGRMDDFIVEHYELHEWKHALSILQGEFEEEFNDICDLLVGMRLKKSWITKPGGNKSKLAHHVDDVLMARGWQEKEFATKVVVDGVETDSPTHKVDCYKNRIAVEIEWNNKDPFYDRDLNNFRLLFDLRAISVGVIITRSSELQDLFNELGRGSTYGQSTTHMSKLLPKIEGGGGGGCPLLAIGITKKLYEVDE